MKAYKVTVHSEDLECVVRVGDNEGEEEAIEKWQSDDVDEWISARPEQPDVTVELYGTKEQLKKWESEEQK